MPQKTRRKPPVKKTKTTRRKTAVKQAANRRNGPEKLSPKEVDALLNQLQSEERSEKAWLEMSSVKPGDDDDRWSAVEEGLVTGGPGAKRQSVKLWKHFAK